MQTRSARGSAHSESGRGCKLAHRVVHLQQPHGALLLLWRHFVMRPRSTA